MKANYYRSWLEAEREDLRRAVILNEVTTGQHYEWFRQVASLEGWFPLDVDLNHMYILRTGLIRPLYRKYDVNAIKYSTLAIEFYIRAEALLQEYGYASECFMDIYGNEKLLFVFFSPTGNECVEPVTAAEGLTCLLQSLYREQFLPEDSPLCNFSVLSRLISSYDEIAPTCFHMKERHKLSFFYMQPVVMSDTLYDQLHKPCAVSQIRVMLHELDDALSHGLSKQVGALSRELLLDKLKYAFSLELLDDAVTGLRSQIARYARIYDLEEARIQIGRSDSYSTIEELAEDVGEKLQLCVDAVNSRKQLSYISQTAVFYIKENYARPITQVDVANYAHVVPNYLSRIFNREMEMSIPAYISKVRLERVCELLENSNLKIREIATGAGISDVKRLNKQFRQTYGMTPGEYRARPGENDSV